MTVFGFTLVLAAAFCHATWNFLVKRINGGPELVWLFSAVSVLIYIPIAAYIILTEKPHFGFWEILFVAGSIPLHLGYFLLLQTGYRKGDLSLVYPTARATGPFLSTTFAVLFLGESMTAQVAVGAGAVIIGVVGLTGGIKSRAKNLTTSIGFGVGAGVLIGSYTIWDAYAVSVVLVSPILLDFVSNIGRTILLTPIALKRKERVAYYWREHRLDVVAVAVFSSLAYVLVLYALTFTPVVYVAPTREISVLLTVLMGSLLLGEGDLARRMKWAMLILVGVALLATA
ncbi:EamA family transporter [Hoeflea sp.]|uniref:EamA family transporter n=1 Tax=Hoeflea sp. TaxID=1940281 RepID=UPI003A8EFE66